MRWTVFLTVLLAAASPSLAQDAGGTEDRPTLPVEVTNFPEAQQVAGTVSVDNFPAVQQVEVVNPSSPGLTNQLLDLLDADVALVPFQEWFSDPFDVSQFTRLGLKVEQAVGGQGISCNVSWAFFNGDRFAGPGLVSSVVPGGNAGFTSVLGVQARVRCGVSFGGSPGGTLTDVKVLLRRE